jgi:hypothetical protein
LAGRSAAFFRFAGAVGGGAGTRGQRGGAMRPSEAAISHDFSPRDPRWWASTARSGRRRLPRSAGSGRELHRLRASCGFVGAARLAEAVRTLETGPHSNVALQRFDEAAGDLLVPA